MYHWVPKNKSVTPIKTLPPEIIIEIMLNLNTTDINSACLANPIFNRACNAAIFWQLKTQRDYGITARDYSRIQLANPRQRYAKVKHYLDAANSDNTRYVLAAMLGFTDLMMQLDGQENIAMAKYKFMHRFCNRYLQPTEQLPLLPVRLQGEPPIPRDNFALYMATRYNNMDVVRYILKKSYSKLTPPFLVLSDIVTAIPDNIDTNEIFWFERIFVSAVASSNRLIYQLFDDPKYQDDIDRIRHDDWTLASGYNINHIQMIDLLHKHDFTINTIAGVIAAKNKNYQQWLDYMFLDPQLNGYNRDELLNLDLHFLVENGIIDNQILDDIKASMISALVHGNFELLLELRKSKHIGLDLMYLLPYINRSVELYGKNRSLISNIISGLQLFYDNRPPEVVDTLIKMLKQPRFSSDSIRDYIEIEFDEER